MYKHCARCCSVYKGVINSGRSLKNLSEIVKHVYRLYKISSAYHQGAKNYAASKNFTMIVIIFIINSLTSKYCTNCLYRKQPTDSSTRPPILPECISLTCMNGLLNGKISQWGQGRSSRAFWVSSSQVVAALGLAKAGNSLPQQQPPRYTLVCLPCKLSYAN